MANELTCTGSVQFAKGQVGAVGMAKSGVKFTVTGGDYVRGTFSVPTTSGGTAIPLGGIATAGGWYFIQNNDSTNYVKIMNAVSGTVVLQIMPLEFAIGRFDAGVTAVAAIAHTAAVVIEYIFVDN
jgi:hypothetical protein